MSFQTLAAYTIGLWISAFISAAEFSIGMASGATLILILATVRWVLLGSESNSREV